MQTELEYTAIFPKSLYELWSETRNRSQSKFSASTNLTETRYYLVLSVHCWHVFCFGFLSVWCMYDWKNYCFGYLYTKMSRIDCFCHVHKILQWNGSSDFKINEWNIIKNNFNRIFNSFTVGWNYNKQNWDLYKSLMYKIKKNMKVEPEVIVLW